MFHRFTHPYLGLTKEMILSHLITSCYSKKMWRALHLPIKFIAFFKEDRHMLSYELCQKAKLLNDL